MEQLETHTLECAVTGYVRNVRVRRLAGARKLAVFLDGGYYLRDIDAVPVVEQLIESGQIPPVNLLFVSSQSSESRLVDYLWNESYARFIGETVTPWARRQLEDPVEGGHLIAGLSLSGLQAALVACRYPAEFSSVLCQSGSFWWLEDNPRPLPPTRQRFWLSVGDQETAENVTHMDTLFQRVSQVHGVEAIAARLQEAGARVLYQPYEGGHAIIHWREELSDALAWCAGVARGDAVSP